MRLSLMFAILVLIPTTQVQADSDIPRGYVFHITGSGSSCDAAKTNAKERAESETAPSGDTTYANNQVENRAQSIALCTVRGGALGFAVTPSDPNFGDSWKPDLTGTGRAPGEDGCAFDSAEGTYHTSNKANGICLSQDERDNPPPAPTLAQE